MKRSLVGIAILAFAVSAFGQGTVTPPSSRVGAPGLVRTPLYLVTHDGKISSDAVNYNYETPSSLACIYGVTQLTPGCPTTGTIVSTGGSKAIAVVEYGNYSNVQNDLVTFSNQFGLGGNTSVINLCYPGPTCPANNGTGWDLEEALDVQYAHAMAPNAQIIVVSFTNDPLGDGAEQGGAQYIATNYSAGEISNSWTYNGGEEWCGSGNCELQYDSDFTQPGIVYFASAGDDGLGVAYPSVSPNVVSAGGTGIVRSNGNYQSETCWSGSGGGISQYEPLPQYQLYVANRTNFKRGTPDRASDSSGNSPVNIYSSSYCGGWCGVYGTSVASPTLAGISNFAGNFRSSTLTDEAPLYQIYIRPVQYETVFYDVTTGSNGSPARPGWDECTGLGSPRIPSYF
ncbi:MAG TPA: S53 family peptidase [Bryocella sp.]|nr:S53 family peptidase [Bryocella sp.]